MARPQGLAPWQHLDAAEQLLEQADTAISAKVLESGEIDSQVVLLSALAHTLLAYAKMIGAQRA